MSWRALQGFRSAQFAVSSRAEAAVPPHIDFASWCTRELGNYLLLAVASVAAVADAQSNHNRSNAAFG